MRIFPSALIASLVVSCGLLVFTPATIAHASDWATGVFNISFGGKIVNVRPCYGSSLAVATILEPPFMTPIDVSVLPSPFLHYFMTHPGQFVLGLLGAPSFCATSPHTGFWAPASFFYGTSI